MTTTRNHPPARVRTQLALATSILLLSAVLGVQSASAFPPEGDQAYATWARTDLPVAAGQVSRTWMWGPEANTPGLPEPYAESPGGLRAVQYFDKSRMEVTHPDGDPASPWYITNGLLVVELMTGRMQVGDDSFEQHEPAEVNVAGDPDDVLGPTYATLADVRGAAPFELGTTLTATIDRAGRVGEQPELAEHGVAATMLTPETGHTVASVFWGFMIEQGLVYENGAVVEGPLFPDPYYATGYPVTEPYWAWLKVGGTERWVLLQAFERRVLTYTPGNPAGWQVEAGNVGQHYYRWRYDDAPPPPNGDQTLTGVVDAIEIAAGSTEGDVTYGAAFVGQIGGDFNAFVEFSIDYTPPEPAPNVVHTIVGGSWRIERDDGVLAGTFTGGTAAWDENEFNAAVTGELLVTEATGVFAAAGGTGTFEGTLSHRTFPPSLDGTLEVTLE